jgi:LytS/YehU family sensor histidine kinase
LALEYAERLKRENLSIQLEGLKNQISPHFLFNSLNTLAAIIPEDPMQSVEFVHKLSHTYRYLLEQKDKNLVELSTELDFIQSYYFLQRIRFGDNLRLTIELPEAYYTRKLPPLSLQLLIENAIKHNVISDQKPLCLSIGIDESGRLLVQNNLQPRLMVEPSTGIGLPNIESRYKHLEVGGMEVKQTDTLFSVYLPLLS